MRQFKAYLKPAKHFPSVLIAFSDGFLTFEIEGAESVAARAEGEWHGKAYVPANYLAALHSVPPIEDPVTLSYDHGKLHIASLAIGCQWDLLSAPLLRRSENPDTVELLALERTLTRPEILGTPLGMKISQAKRLAGSAVTRAAKALAPFGIQRTQVEALLERQIQSRLRRG